MATIYNSSLTKELTDVAKIQVSRDSVPNQLAEKVVPVIDVNPKHARILNIVRATTMTNGTTTTMFTTDASRETYISSCSLAFIKDATSTATNIALTCIIDGVTQTLIRLPGITLTASSDSLAMSFPFPIKVDKGSAITITSDTNVANIIVKATLQGFNIDNPNA
jgi:hypothetical protein